MVIVDLSAAATYGFVFLGGDDPDLLFLGLVAFFVFMHSDSRALIIAWIIAFPIIVSSQIALEYVFCDHVELTMYLICSVFVIFTSLIGSLIRYYRQARSRIARLYADLEISHKQLAAYAQTVEETAIYRERIRIARDIHDTVGHAMTTLLVQLQAVRKLQETDISKSREYMLHCEELARSALREVRLSVRAMRGATNELPLKLTLDKLIRDYAVSTGIAIVFHSEADYPALPEPLQTTLLRTVQESLTNVQKHSHATEITINLAFADHRIKLTISDNGEGQSSVVPGFGLLNMRERMEEHGGIARWFSGNDGGFTVEAVMPYVEFDSGGGKEIR